MFVVRKLKKWKINEFGKNGEKIINKDIKRKKMKEGEKMEKENIYVSSVRKT